MKTIKLFVIASSLSFLTQQCYKQNSWGIKGSGPVVTEVRPVENFTRINLSIDADLNFIQDSVFKLEVNGQSNILAVLETEVRSEELHIEYKRNVWDHSRVKITVHAPTINKFSVSGSGNIWIQNNLTGGNLDVTVSGSGAVNIPSLTVNYLGANISGSGELSVVSGTVNNENFIISGSGKIGTEYLKSNSTMVNVSGSGLALVNAKESLNVTISGSGSVKYRGNPLITSEITGTGKLIRLN